MTDNNYQYLMNGARLTNYSVIPNTVCEMNISSTAKVIYAKLLNRAQLSASKTMYDWNFEHDDGTVDVMVHAKNYVEHYDEMMTNHIGLLFWGDVGTGKSFMAGCIANALLEKEYTVKMTNFSTIINDLFACDDKNEYIEALSKYSLLIIDDLGAERSTEYATENVFNVIDRRYRSGKPLIITTNLELAELLEEESVSRKRIYDRILEMCVPVKVCGASKRVDAVKNKVAFMSACNSNSVDINE